MQYCLWNRNHSKVYQKEVYLSAGKQYLFWTSNLQGDNPDTYMYLVRGARPSYTSTVHQPVVAYNDDHNGLASLIAYYCNQSGYYQIIVRGYSKYSKGKCDVWQRVDNRDTKLTNDWRFGGYPVSARWKYDETLENVDITGDTMLFIHDSSYQEMWQNDDVGGGSLRSRIRPGRSGAGKLFIGSWRHATRGQCDLCNHYMSYLHNPSETPSKEKRIRITDNMFKLAMEIQKYKERFDKMSMDERIKLGEQEREIEQMADKTLTKEEIQMLEVPKLVVDQRFREASNEYSKILDAEKERLDSLPVEDRIKEMEKIEAKKAKIFEGIVP